MRYDVLFHCCQPAPLNGLKHCSHTLQHTKRPACHHGNGASHPPWQDRMKLQPSTRGGWQPRRCNQSPGNTRCQHQQKQCCVEKHGAQAGHEHAPHILLRGPAKDVRSRLTKPSSVSSSTSFSTAAAAAHGVNLLIPSGEQLSASAWRQPALLTQAWAPLFETQV